MAISGKAVIDEGKESAESIEFDTFNFKCVGNERRDLFDVLTKIIVNMKENVSGKYFRLFRSLEDMTLQKADKSGIIWTLRANTESFLMLWYDLNKHYNGGKNAD